MGNHTRKEEEGRIIESAGESTRLRLFAFARFFCVAYVPEAPHLPECCIKKALEYKPNKSLKKRLEEIIDFTGDENDYVVSSDLECLKYLHENGCSWNEEVCCYAASGGHFEILIYLHENGCPRDRNTCSSAARGGHLEILKYLREEGCPWDERTCSSAARGGHLECLKYLHERGCPWNEENCSSAAKGHIEILNYLESESGFDFITRKRAS